MSQHCRTLVFSVKLIPAANADQLFRSPFESLPAKFVHFFPLARVAHADTCVGKNCELATKTKSKTYSTVLTVRDFTMETTMGMVQESKVVVGLDFGTTFSGFAYALRADPDQIYTPYDWPMQAEAGGLPYCKTQTSLLYADASGPRSDDPFQLLEWGWPAFVKLNSSSADSASVASVTRTMDVLSHPGGKQKASGRQHFVKLFKLHLATKGSTSAAWDSASAPALPQGLTASRAITDYLRQITAFIVQEVRNKFGSHICLDDIEWCVTVPAIWDEHAKKEMRKCSELAGLVQGPLGEVGAGSPHPLKLFIEPEAASVYCQLKVKEHTWSKGDKFLVVDCGGGTVDLVLHEKLGSGSSVSVREVEESSGGLCGGSQVDEEFFKFLKLRISCFERFRREYPATVAAFCQEWEKVKYDYAGEVKDVYLELPPKLAEMWEEDRSNSSLSYDEVVLTNGDMKSIFDPVVSKILLLVSMRLVSDLKAIIVVGGFSASPYLMRRIRETFDGRVAAIVSPPFPGSAVCCGAVTMGIRSDTVVSRVSKRTYGTDIAVPFIYGVHPESLRIVGDSGQSYCESVFRKYVTKGDEVLCNDSVKRVLFPLLKSQTQVRVGLYSTDSREVSFVTDPDVQLEGEFRMQIPSGMKLGFDPKVEVAMFFGRSDIQVTAMGLNFDSPKKKMLSVEFESHCIF